MLFEFIDEINFLLWFGRIGTDRKRQVGQQLLYLWLATCLHARLGYLEVQEISPLRSLVEEIFGNIQRL